MSTSEFRVNEPFTEINWSGMHGIDNIVVHLIRFTLGVQRYQQMWRSSSTTDPNNSKPETEPFRFGTKYLGFQNKEN